MSDPWLSLTILAVSVVVGWWFLRWDRRMEQRDQAHLAAELSELRRRANKQSEEI
jgi:uncharacterized membrane-anchored protein YhcB (DUF1043 family)